MANYDVTQLTDGAYEYDRSFPLNLYPTISDDGSRVVFLSKLEPSRPGYYIFFYDQDRDDEPQLLSVNVSGDDHTLCSSRAQVSGNGQHIVFAVQAYLTDEDETGVYVYNIDSGTIRLVVCDKIPRFSNGVPMPGEPGMEKFESSMPSISSNGERIACVWKDFEGTSSGHWKMTRQRLMLADLSGDTVRGGTLLEIDCDIYPFPHGHGIKSLRISGCGRLITFYAGGVVEGLAVSNLEMPPYEPEPDRVGGSTVGDVFCYVVRTHPGERTLQVVAEPDSPERPLLVAHPETHNVQSFNMPSILGNPPSVCFDGSRVALNAGFVMGAANTGIYVFEPYGPSPKTHEVITFGERPGIYPGGALLTTGAAPAISPDGFWLGYYRRTVRFREGYADPSAYEEGDSYCPAIESDDVEVRQIPRGDISNLIYSGDPVRPISTPALGLGVARDASHVAFVSRADKVGRNTDYSHEVYYATLVTE